MVFAGARLLFVVLASGLLCAQSSAETAGSSVSPPITMPSLGPVKLSGLYDTYYSYGFNHPASGVTQLRNFDTRSGGIGLNMAKLKFELPAEPVGFTVDTGYGRAFDLFHSTDPALSKIHYLMQAYVSYQPSQLGGAQFDFGKFFTSAGAEVTETHLNWNYSRALLYANGPYYHFGFRSTVPIGKHFTGGFQLVNGWNNVQDNNSGKTLGFTGAATFSKIAWFNTYYVGPETTATTQGQRHFYDTVLLLTPTDRYNFYVNFDYGTDRSVDGGPNRFAGIAGAARVKLSRKTAISPRVEWYNDVRGLITGTAQRLKEVTVTGEYVVHSNLLARLEYRKDWSNQPFFQRGGSPSSFRNQATVLLGFVAYLNPRSK